MQVLIREEFFVGSFPNLGIMGFMKEYVSRVIISLGLHRDINIEPECAGRSMKAIRN